MMKNERTTAGLRILPAILLAILATASGCSGEKNRAESLPGALETEIESFRTDDTDPTGEPATGETPEEHPAVAAVTSMLGHAGVMAILMPYDTVKAHNPYEAHFDSMPPGGIKMKINGLGGYLGTSGDRHRAWSASRPARHTTSTI